MAGAPVLTTVGIVYELEHSTNPRLLEQKHKDLTYGSSASELDNGRQDPGKQAPSRQLFPSRVHTP